MIDQILWFEIYRIPLILWIAGVIFITVGCMIEHARLYPHVYYPNHNPYYYPQPPYYNPYAYNAWWTPRTTIYTAPMHTTYNSTPSRPTSSTSYATTERR